MSKDAFLLIRGSRILDQLVLTETTMDSLENNSGGLPSKRGDSAHSAIQGVNIEPIRRANSDTGDLKITFDVNSGSSGKKYSPVIYFMDVEFDETDEADNITFNSTGGGEHHIQPVSLRRTNVKVRCSCMDFYYRFASRNSKDGSLYGNPPPPYTKKTQNRPSANPENVPGVCKHILAGVSDLRSTGIVIA